MESNRTKKELRAENGAPRRRMAGLERALNPSPPERLGVAASDTPPVEPDHPREPFADHRGHPPQAGGARIPVLIAYVDARQRIQFQNRSHLDWFGGQRRHSQGKPIGEVLDARTFQTILPRIKAALAGEAQHFEVEVEGPAGDARVMQAHYVPHFGENGAVLGFDSTVLDVTEQRRAEGALEESQMRLSGILDVAGEAIVSVDENQKIVLFNKGAEKIFGFREKETLGQPLNLLLPQSAQATHGHHVEQFADEGAVSRQMSERGEILGRRKNGEHFPAEASISKIRIGGRNFFTAVLRDITGREKADEARRESEGLLKIFFDRGPLLAATKGPDGRYLSVNGKWCEFYGTTPEAVLGKLPTELPFLSTEKGEQTVAEDRASSEGRVVEIHDQVSTDKRREKRFLYTVKMPVREGEGTRVSVVAMSMDVTEQKRAEEALSKSRELLETIFETIPAAVFVKDPEGRFTMMNRVLAERFGTTPEKTVGLRPEQLGASPEMVRRSSETDREVIETKKMVQLPEQWVGLHKGKKIWSQVIKAPILDNAGRVSGIVGVGFDVTARKTIEEQLRQSQKMEALGTLAGGIAHALNNILSPILGYSELLLAKAPEESEDRTFAGAIVESAQRAKELVSQILIFGRRARAEKRVIDLGPLVRELAKFTRSTLPKTMVVREEISTGPAPVFCDRSQIHQVLLNLCVNAGQAIPDFGEITIGLATVELDGFECFFGQVLSGEHVRIAVRDNGIGMDRETLGNIFDPFFTTKGVGEGTGLGLSTVFGIVQSHGGGIAVSSEPGAGTTFEVFLPLAEQAAENPTNPGAHVAKGGSENILFVDDEQAIVKLAKVFLEQAGYHVTAAFDGRQALEIFSKNPGRFDLVVTDQTMPNMTGEMLARRLLALRRELPIILCTGNSENISPGDCQSLGIRKFLFKPISPAELGRAIRSVLNEANRVSPPG